MIKYQEDPFALNCILLCFYYLNILNIYTFIIIYIYIKYYNFILYKHLNY